MPGVASFWPASSRTTRAVISVMMGVSAQLFGRRADRAEEHDLLAGESAPPDVAEEAARLRGLLRGARASAR